LKVVSVSGWFAARPSGTENIYKLYAESLKSAEQPHRHRESGPGDRSSFSRRELNRTRTIFRMILKNNFSRALNPNSEIELKN
jgi:hypothetical protein